VEIQFIVGIDGNVEVDVKEVGAGLDGRRLSYLSQRNLQLEQLHHIYDGLGRAPFESFR